MNNNFSGRKREILLSKEIPEEFTNSQLNNSQYISKMAMKLLSNIVREKDEDTFRSKNVLATNGAITTTLKRHWQLNDAWNEIISPRFKRLNELTSTNLYGGYREINGHKVFINTVPEETNKNFDSKRIDHRHHALDALIIALSTENHVNYLNNISSQESNEEKLNTRKGIKFQLTNSRRGFNDEKEWYFLPPAQIKTKDGIDEFEYQFKDFKSKVFKDIAQNALENTIASFKQKNRVIRQRWNKYLKSEDGKLDIVPQEGLNKKKNYNVRQSLHDATFYGRTNLYYETLIMKIEKAIEEGFVIVDSNIRNEIENLKKDNISYTKIISTLSTQHQNVQVYNKFIASRYNGELEKFASIPSNAIEDKIKTITDTSIQKILTNHIKNYIELDEKQKEFYNTEKAFSPDGILEMNNNILVLNEGKPHQKIFKVRTAGKMGKAFPVSENVLKNSKIVKTAGDSNFYCGFYQKGIDRKFYIPTLRESVESLKQGFEPCPQTHPEDSEFKLIFVLNPSDFVYVPTEEENENPNLINFNNLKKEQIGRIYKFTDGSGTTMNFVPANIASLLFSMSNKEQEKAEIKLSIQNELGLGSPQSKNQNTVDGIQVKSVCWKLRVDRLGNILKA